MVKTELLREDEREMVNESLHTQTNVLLSRLCEARAASAELQREHEVLQRTVKFMEEEYLREHGGSWGKCKWQRQVEGLREALKYAKMAMEQHMMYATALEKIDEAVAMADAAMAKEQK